MKHRSANTANTTLVEQNSKPWQSKRYTTIFAATLPDGPSALGVTVAVWSAELPSPPPSADSLVRAVSTSSVLEESLNPFWRLELLRCAAMSSRGGEAPAPETRAQPSSGTGSSMPPALE
jgi:hypothetical protein